MSRKTTIPTHSQTQRREGNNEVRARAPPIIPETDMARHTHADVHIEKEATEQHRSTQARTEVGMRGSTIRKEREQPEEREGRKRAHAEVSCEFVGVRTLASGETVSKHVTRDGKGVGEKRGRGAAEEEQQRE